MRWVKEAMASIRDLVFLAGGLFAATVAVACVIEGMEQHRELLFFAGLFVGWLVYRMIRRL